MAKNKDKRTKELEAAKKLLEEEEQRKKLAEDQNADSDVIEVSAGEPSPAPKPPVPEMDTLKDAAQIYQQKYSGIHRMEDYNSPQMAQNDLLFGIFVELRELNKMLRNKD